VLRIAVLGASGRMGVALTRLIAASDDCQLVGAAAMRGDAAIGRDAGEVAGIRRLGVAVTESAAQAVANSAVAIDFTSAAATQGHLAVCARQGCALVLGTTGLSASDQDALVRTARQIPLVHARNMSIGIFVLTEAARLVTRLIGQHADIEISETHHRHKVDAPSGTALQLGEAIAEELGHPLEELASVGRQADLGPRRPGSIGFASLRAGNVVGDHTVLIALEDEILRLEHSALDRATFARGALRSARWVAGRPPGLYGLRDVMAATPLE
jgi:4-hydroxy-tetrahydrodipicolinate reductase